MNQTEKQHHLAVGLLEVLDLTQIRLEQQQDGSFTFAAWNTPSLHGNGSPRILKRGKVETKRG